MEDHVKFQTRRNITMICERAGCSVRASALCIDLLIITMIASIPYLLYTFSGDKISVRPSMILIVSIALLLLVLRDTVGGASLGKRLFAIGVRDEKDIGQVPSCIMLLIRNLFIVVLPLEICMLLRPVKSRLGDRAVHANVFNIGKKSILSDIIIGFLVVVFTIGLLFFGINMSYARSDAYAIAVAHICTDAKLMDQIGEIQRRPHLRNGSIDLMNGYQEAYFVFLVEGSRKSVYTGVYLDKEIDGEWTIYSGEF